MEEKPLENTEKDGVPQRRATPVHTYSPRTRQFCDSHRHQFFMSR
ncbi:hypothetical protein ABFU26_05305 [Xanthomonas campestris pv. raphani]|nr:hypothetical protein [Xanthomonas campestris]MEA9480126.1 hypothetical protein [Xanthomonas campestris]